MNKRLFSKEYQYTLYLILIIFAVMIIGLLRLDDDFLIAMKWWVTLLVFGMIAIPLSSILFSHFSDFGWVVSKVLTLAFASWIMWLLSSIKLVRFSQMSCILSVLIVFLFNVVLYIKVLRKHKDHWIEKIKSGNVINAILFAEILFLAMFLFWTYLRGYNPQAYGTEKFMDFGFMKTISRQDYMPPNDLWFAGEKLNYYYLGQYIMTFICKCSGIPVEYGYNLALSTIFGLLFAMTYSLTRNLFTETVSEKHPMLPSVAGMISAVAINFSGNCHYIIYGLLRPEIQVLLGKEVTSYWYPDATRFIRTQPNVDAYIIHEFPDYAHMVGDLHAHLINTIFVVALLTMMFSWLQYRKSIAGEYSLIREICMPHILILGFFIGLFKGINYWDFPIYYVVCGAVIFFSNIGLFKTWKERLLVTAAQGLLVLVISSLVILPFTLSFDMISSQIGIVKYRSPLSQMAILYGLPIVVSILYLVYLIRQKDPKHTQFENNYVLNLLTRLFISDLYIVVLSLCAIGLILVPELIFIKDIYDGGTLRTNTVFKCVFQAYLMFDIIIGYLFVKLFTIKEKIARKTCVVCFVLWVGTLGYFRPALHSALLDNHTYEGLDASTFLTRESPADANAILWLNENAGANDVVLEANGDSYTLSNRVSVFTGNPTVLGWWGHEYLWRSNGIPEEPQVVAERVQEIQTFYGATDYEVAKSFIDKYNVKYIYIGKCEWEKYPNMNVEFLKTLGNVVFEETSNMNLKINGQEENGDRTTYIIEIQ